MSIAVTLAAQAIRWQEGGGKTSLEDLQAIRSAIIQQDSERALLHKALQAIVLVLNTRGELSEGGSDFNTSIGNAYRAASILLDRTSKET